MTSDGRDLPAPVDVYPAGVTEKPMTKGEREELKRLARERQRVAKSDAKSRAADLKASFEHQVTTIYEYDRDEVWKEIAKDAEAYVAEAQQKVEERCVALGIPREFAPILTVQWHGRGQWAQAARQNELRRAAMKRIDAMERAAVAEIDRKALSVQTELVKAGLTTDAAVGFLDDMPQPEALMPAIDLRELMEGDRRPPLDPDGFFGEGEF